MTTNTNLNTNLDYQQQIKNFVDKFRAETVVKILLSTALLVAATVAVVFLSSYFLTSGIGIIIISSFAIYKYFTCYYDSKNIFALAAASAAKSLGLALPQ